MSKPTKRRQRTATVRRGAAALPIVKRIRKNSGAPPAPRTGTPARIDPIIMPLTPILEELLMAMRVPVVFPGGPQPPSDRQWAARAVKWARRHFEESNNPLYVWRAYLECRGAALPVPDWVVHYFDGVGCKLLSLATAPDLLAHWQETPKATRSAVLAALGMKKRGRGNVFTGFDRTTEMLLAERVHWHMKGGTKLDFAYDEVSRERKTGRSTVRRAWKKHCSLFGVSTKRPTF